MFLLFFIFPILPIVSSLTKPVGIASTKLEFSYHLILEELSRSWSEKQVLFYEYEESTMNGSRLDLDNGDVFVLAGHQIAVIRNEFHLLQLIEAEIFRMQTHFERMLIIVLSPIETSTVFNTTRLCLICTWVFLRQEFVPSDLEKYLRYTDQIFVIDPEKGMISEMYGIRGHLFLNSFDLADFPVDHNIASFSVMDRLDLQGSEIDIAMVREGNGNFRTTSSGDETLQVIHGRTDTLLYTRIFAFMQDYLRFRARFHPVSSWVYAGPNQTSMADLIVANQVDIALSDVSLFQNDGKYRFLYPTVVERAKLHVIYKLTTYTQRRGVYEGVFSAAVLVCLFATITLIMISSNLFCTNDNESRIIWIIGIITGQGGKEPVAKYRISARILTLVTLIFHFLCSTCISSHLVSKLAYVNEIVTLQNLVHRGIKFGMESNSVAEDSLNVYTKVPGSPLWDVRSGMRFLGTEVQGVEEVLRNDKFAFITTADIENKYEEELKVCGKLNRLDIDEDRMRSIGPFISPNSEFSEPFNFARLVMAQSGITRMYDQRVQKIGEMRRDDCSKSISSSNMDMSLSFHDVKINVYILLIGVSAGVLILILEKMVRRLEILSES